MTPLAQLREEISQLRAWKRSAQAVLDDCRFQEVGVELGVGLGCEVAPAILPGIRALKAVVASRDERITHLEAVCDDLRKWGHALLDSDVPTTTINRMFRYRVGLSGPIYQWVDTPYDGYTAGWTSGSGPSVIAEEELRRLASFRCVYHVPDEVQR
jgi:hypothetical protein